MRHLPVAESINDAVALSRRRSSIVVLSDELTRVTSTRCCSSVGRYSSLLQQGERYYHSSHRLFISRNLYHIPLGSPPKRAACLDRRVRKSQRSFEGPATESGLAAIRPGPIEWTQSSSSALRLRSVGRSMPWSDECLLGLKQPTYSGRGY